VSTPVPIKAIVRASDSALLAELAIDGPRFLDAVRSVPRVVAFKRLSTLVHRGHVTEQGGIYAITDEGMEALCSADTSGRFTPSSSSQTSICSGSASDARPGDGGSGSAA
jgi:hypothetical protein